MLGPGVQCPLFGSWKKGSLDKKGKINYARVDTSREPGRENGAMTEERKKGNGLLPLSAPGPKGKKRVNSTPWVHS